MIAIENEIPNVINLVNKTDYDTKITEIEKNFLIMIMINILLLLSLYAFAEFFDAILKQADLVTKTDFNDKLKRLNQKINSNKTKHFLVENELKNLKTFDSIYILEVKAILKKMVHKII